MKFYSKLLVLPAVAVLLTACATPKGDTPEDKRAYIDKQHDITVQAVMKEKGLEQAEIDEAVGHASFTNIGTQVLLIGGDDGYGVVTDTETGEKTYVKMGAVDFGPGLGVAKYRTLILFEDQDTLTDFTSGTWEWAAETAAVAKTGDGEGGSAEMAAGFDKGLKIYVVGEEGFKAKVNLTGFSVEPFEELN
jgi:lipid-binding SYLF domain-containing protein